MIVWSEFTVLHKTLLLGPTGNSGDDFAANVVFEEFFVFQGFLALSATS